MVVFQKTKKKSFHQRELHIFKESFNNIYTIQCAIKRLINIINYFFAYWYFFVTENDAKAHVKFFWDSELASQNII